ncbi:MAG: hypothetical protein ACE5F9_12795 [Phycisphaerae bacterium]
MKTKTFDCVKMKHAAQEMIRAALAGLSREEEIAYFRAGAEEFEERAAAARTALLNDRNSPGNACQD